MKKNITILSALLLAGATVFTSCKKDDVTAPVVTLNGGDQTVVLNSTFTDLGATANDNKDGDITASVSGVVDVNNAGSYQLTYTATDAAGNEGTATRNVTVYNQAAGWAGDYNGNEIDALGPYTYAGNSDAAKVVKVSASTTINNQIWINRLGDFANNKVYMNVTGNSINIPNQTVTSVGTGTATCDVHDRSSNGTGSKITSASVNTFTLAYTDSKVSPCSGTRAAVTATFVAK